jgi:hypothetical protein
MKHFNELIEDYINVIIHEQVHNQPKADRAAECLQGYVLKRFCDELRLLRKFQNTDKIDTVARYIALLRNDNSTWEDAYDKYMSYFHNELTF